MVLQSCPVSEASWSNLDNEASDYVLGGSMIELIATVSSRLIDDIDWKRIVYFFCDERLVPIDDKESTYGEYKRKFIPVMGGAVTESNFIPIELGLNGLCVQDLIIECF